MKQVLLHPIRVGADSEFKHTGCAWH
jgi:hypothetical protein